MAQTHAQVPLFRRRWLVAVAILSMLGALLVGAVAAAGPAAANVDESQPWWQHSLTERTLNAVNNGQTLQDVQNNLDLYKAQGYQVINLDWPVSAGPTFIYNGFSASDYMHVDPRLAVGSTDPDTDWTTFVAAAHQRGLKVTTWFNPSYVWTGSAMFKAAEAEVRLHGPNYSDQSAGNPAKYFKWMATTGGGIQAMRHL